MIIPLKLSDEETEQYKTFAKEQHQTVSIMIRTVVKEKIQNETDWSTYKEALADFQISSKSFTLKEIKRELGLR